MADMDVDPPAAPAKNASKKDDGKEGKKRFEVKKVGRLLVPLDSRQNAYSTISGTRYRCGHGTLL